MFTRGLALVLLLTGCTQVINDARPRAQAPVAPITAGQVSDLLSEKAKPDDDPNLFVTVEPEECAGLAREVDPPFIFGTTTPAAHDGGQWYTEPPDDFSIVEMVGVYRADFDSAAAVDEVKRTLESCQDKILTATAMEGQEVDFNPLSEVDSGSPEIVLWSVGGDWACDNAFIAAHNAAIEITACSDVNGYDVLPLAQDALKRIEALAKTTA